MAQASNPPWRYDAVTFRYIVDPPRIHLSTYDLTALPAIKLLGTTSTKEQTAVDTYSAYSGWGVDILEPLWPSPGTLVWAGRGETRSWWLPAWIDPAPYKVFRWVWRETPDNLTGGEWVSEETGESIDPPGYWSPEWRYSDGKQLFAFDVTAAEAPRHVSTFDLGKGEPWEVGQPFAAQGSIYMSHRHLGIVRAGEEYVGNDVRFSRANGFSPPKVDDLFNRHFLDVIDYADPAAPVLSEDHPNLPGRLVGLSRHGMLLYTMGQGYDLLTGSPVAEATALHASAFDGTAAHLLDAIPLAAEGQPFVLDGETVFLLKPEPARIFKQGEDKLNYWDGAWEDNPAKTTLATWTLTDLGKFAKLGEITLQHESNLSLFGRLAVAHGGASRGGIFLRWGWNCFGWHGGDSRTLHFVDAVDAANLRDLGTYTFEGWIYPNLTFADGDDQRGLWVPLGEYGVEQVARPAQ